MADLLEGLVISHLGKGLAIEHAGKTIICQTRRQLGVAAVGDRVLWERTGTDQGRVAELLPRRSVLTRPARQGKTRPVAANIDKVIVVFATHPNCDFLLIDQYLAVCENRNISAELVFNKIDLAPTPERDVILDELTRYQAMGYPLHCVSATTGKGLSTLTTTLLNQTSILAGQSGVGKSSLTNALIPDKALKTNTLSEANSHGRHTTTAATLYHLPSGGDLIDSPGVAIFGLAGLSEAQLAYGFREFQPFIEACQFNDCQHQKDKGCAVRQAVEDQSISQTRYQRYLKLKEKMKL
ncbi:MAG: ribosome small subunit-dependent GTPase A [Methylococcales bacterium]|jgi:ribosome biogenesis GTPase|nr:ribosome small subunit-dependent GTPase A [Methylococcaceae bacterium]